MAEDGRQEWEGSDLAREWIERSGPATTVKELEEAGLRLTVFSLPWHWEMDGKTPRWKVVVENERLKLYCRDMALVGAQSLSAVKIAGRLFIWECSGIMKAADGVFAFCYEMSAVGGAKEAALTLERKRGKSSVMSIADLDSDQFNLALEERRQMRMVTDERKSRGKFRRSVI